MVPELPELELFCSPLEPQPAAANVEAATTATTDRDLDLDLTAEPLVVG
jgi:hypothetical protein